MKSIFYKLLITFFIVSIIPIITITIISYSISEQNFMDTMGNSNLQTAVQINKSIEAMLLSIENMVNIMLIEDPVTYHNIIKNILEKEGPYNDNEISMHIKDVESYLSRFASFQKYVESVYVVGSNELKLSSPNQLLSTKFLDEFSWYSSFKNSKENVRWTGIHISQDYNVESNSYVVSYMKKIKNRLNTKDLGIIWVDVNQRWITEIYSGMGITPSAEIFIIDDEGKVISHPNRNMLEKNILPQKCLDYILNDNRGYFIEKVNNISTMIAFDTLYKNQWKTVYKIPISEVIESSIKVKNKIYSVTFILLVITIMMILVLSYTISSPLKNLMRLMQKAANGDFKVKAKVRSKDEVGQLCRIFNEMILSIDNLIRLVYEVETKQKEAEFTSLQSQINPHFLYNTLQTIKWMADFHDVPDIGKIVISLSRILRFTIKSKKQVSIQDEINNTIDYIAIQKYRYEERLQVEWEIDEDICNIKVPNLILQPMVENAMRHGIELKAGKGLIVISCKRDNGSVKIKVWDNGIGIEEEKLNELMNILEGSLAVEINNNSIGLKNISDRLKLMYGEAAYVQLESLKGVFTCITVVIPLENLKNTN